MMSFFKSSTSDVLTQGKIIKMFLSRVAAGEKLVV